MASGGAERVDQLTWRGGLRRWPQRFRISDGRDNDALAAQHRLLQALQDGSGCSRMMNEQIQVSSI
jgi:hypothetical protein